MKNKVLRTLFALMLGWCSSGCIVNDIPYPVIVGEITEISFSGQKSCDIDAAKRLVTLVLDDTVDMRSVEVLSLELNEQARSTIKVGDLLDFSDKQPGTYVLSDSPYKLTVSTYQDYEWQIKVSQPIDRKIVVDGSVGEAQIDIGNRTVLVNVSEATTDLYGIVVREFCLAPSVAIYSPDPFETTNFSRPVLFTASYFGLTEEWTVIVSQVQSNVSTGSVNAWAKFARVTGDVVAGSLLTPAFEYRKKNDTEWMVEPAVVSGGKLSAVLKDLSANTDYEFRAKLGEEVASSVEFRTQATPVIPNMGFEEWTLKGSNWYANATAAHTFWAVANEGVTMIGNKPSNSTPTTDCHEGEKAARVETMGGIPIYNLAAGSVFTGDFTLNMAKPLESPNFSRPYAGRPTQLKFWYKYAPKKVDVVNQRPQQTNEMDRCWVYIYLGDWEGFLKTADLKKENTRGVIAFGEFVSDKPVGEYTQQAINIKYFDLNRPVTKILIVASASILGDSYTGGVGSTLYVDGLEFGWDFVE